MTIHRLHFCFHGFRLNTVPITLSTKLLPLLKNLYDTYMTSLLLYLRKSLTEPLPTVNSCLVRGEQRTFFRNQICFHDGSIFFNLLQWLCLVLLCPALLFMSCIYKSQQPPFHVLQSTGIITLSSFILLYCLFSYLNYGQPLLLLLLVSFL